MTGIKYDDAKPDYSMLELDALEGVVRVLMYGEKKYARSNWRQVKPLRRYFSALLRHVALYQGGQQFDEETKLSHLAHIATNAMFLLWFEKHRGFVPDSLNELDVKDRQQPAQQPVRQPPSGQRPASGPLLSIESETDTSGTLESVQARISQLLREKQRLNAMPHSVLPGSEKAAAETPAPEPSMSATQTTPAISYEDMEYPSPHTRKVQK